MQEYQIDSDRREECGSPISSERSIQCLRIDFRMISRVVWSLPGTYGANRGADTRSRKTGETWDTPTPVSAGQFGLVSNDILLSTNQCDPPCVVLPGRKSNSPSPGAFDLASW